MVTIKKSRREEWSDSIPTAYGKFYIGCWPTSRSFNIISINTGCGSIYNADFGLEKEDKGCSWRRGLPKVIKATSAMTELGAAEESSYMS